MPTISTIIVSYNTRELLRDCLDSLRRVTLPNRVVVVDCASHDGSAEMVRTAFPEVLLLEPGRNLGFAGANNLGLAALGLIALDGQPTLADMPPDYVLLLNPDTLVRENAIEQMVAFLEAHPRVGAVGPRLLNPDGSYQAAAFRFPTLSMTVLDLFPPGEVLPGRLYNSWWHGRYPQEQRDSEPFPIDHPLGACILARRAAVEQIGGLDDGFFMYAEEVDWCYRMRQAGWAIWQVPAAQIVHFGGASTSQLRSRMFITLYESRLRFFRKHYRPTLVRWHRRIIRLGMLRANLRLWYAYLTGKLNRDELRAQLWTHGSVFQL